MTTSLFIVTCNLVFHQSPSNKRVKNHPIVTSQRKIKNIQKTLEVHPNILVVDLLDKKKFEDSIGL